ncbi:MAG: hypothetical protein ISR58_11650 [Anaerolineales bacterium]|nr:hypothetical protein [Chloroflexota bacterium]MBL6981830.1 hypothetical protein [Anaerolineales bacterium]
MHTTYEGAAIARFQLLQHQLKGRIKFESHRVSCDFEPATICRLLGAFLIALGMRLSRSSETALGISPQPTKS